MARVQLLNGHCAAKPSMLDLDDSFYGFKLAPSSPSAALLCELHNRSRTHLSLNKDAPMRRPVHALGSIEARPVLGGLHHHYVRI
jgi:hypothetical protein